VLKIVKAEFREEAHNVERTDFRRIEQMLRYGAKQRKLLESPGFTGAQIIRNL
jgi:hypothetical protein